MWKVEHERFLAIQVIIVHVECIVIDGSEQRVLPITPSFPSTLVIYCRLSPVDITGDAMSSDCTHFKHLTILKNPLIAQGAPCMLYGSLKPEVVWNEVDVVNLFITAASLHKLEHARPVFSPLKRLSFPVSSVHNVDVQMLLGEHKFRYGDCIADSVDAGLPDHSYDKGWVQNDQI